ncbi:hypothetical protein [Methanimicrococcus hacksteinii]|uniref:hypothetical protein n=1 Tax=Methanimicrococcus hacksteinii TaxID=3028293 RepID=UPI00298EE4D1|nr:hypothetical protein [Methanimicrococcus sp. At1]
MLVSCRLSVAGCRLLSASAMIASQLHFHMHHIIFITSVRYANVGTATYRFRLPQLPYCFRLLLSAQLSRSRPHSCPRPCRAFASFEC